MPIEELLALYNCVPPPMPTTSLSSDSTSKRSSRRARSSSAIQPENTPSVPDLLPPTTAIESAACSEQKSDVSSKHNSTESVTYVPLAKETEQEKSNTDKAIKTSEKIEFESLDASWITTAYPDETKVKNENEKVEAVAKVESKPMESVELSRESECTEMDEGDDDDEEEDESELRILYPETFKTNEPRLLRGKWTVWRCITNNYTNYVQFNENSISIATSRQNSDEDEEEGEDIDYSPEEDEFKKVSCNKLTVKH